jgi:Pectate lyase superfamily protein/Periplasmic copper-binding protein (NosD)
MAVYLSPVGGVAAQFFTNTGSVLTGGKLYSYAAGTTTPLPTYTSNSGGTANTNPIILDSAGRVPNSGEIWLADNTQYKFALYDATNVLIATWDNINGINSNFSNYIANQEIQTATAGQTVFTLANAYVPGAGTLSVFVDGVNQYGPGASYAYTETNANTVTFTNGLHVGASVKFTTVQTLTTTQTTTAALTTYNQGGTGAVTTTVQAKLQQTVSVKDFGAVGDGVTDDTAAITLAVQSNTSVLVPSGYTFLVRNLIIDGKTNFRIFGGGTLKLTGGANIRSRVILFTNCNDFDVDGLVIDGNKTNLTEVSSAQRVYDGIAVSASKRFRIINNNVKNVFFGAGINCSDNGSDITNFNTEAIVGFNIVKDCGITSLGIGACDGIFCNSDNTLVIGNQIYNVTDYGIAADFSQNLNIQSNIIRGDASLPADSRIVCAIGILGAHHWLVSNNIVELCQIGINVTLSGNSPIAPYLSDDVTISNNIIRNISSTVYQGEGIVIDPSASNISVLGNSLQSTKIGISCVSNNSIISNNRINGSTAGVGIYAGGVNTQITGNVVNTSVTDGIYASGTNIVVTGNSINGTGAYGINYVSSTGARGWNNFSSIGSSNEFGGAYVLNQGLLASSWTNVTSSRVGGTVYQNTTPSRMKVQITVAGATSGTLDTRVGVDTVNTMASAVEVSFVQVLQNAAAGTNWIGTHSFEVPPNAFYRLTLTVGTITKWCELVE